METWSLKLYSWLSDINSTFSLFKIHKKIINNYSLETNNFPITAVLLWIILYKIYTKCLHLLFRRMQYPLVARRRIIDGIWTIGFAFSSLFYLKLLVPESFDPICLLKRPRYLELGFILHKSYYLHRGFVEISTHNSWLQGIINLLFCAIIHSSSEQKSFDIVIKLLVCKSTLTVIINFCRIISSVKNIKRRLLIVKSLLVIHFFNWIYVNYIIIPESKLWNSKGLKNDWFTLICLWVWLFLELFNEMDNIRLASNNSSHKIEAYLFPPPTPEMIEIKNICKKLRERSSNQDYDLTNDKKKAELWQTLCCAMTLKKKAKRMREAKTKALNLDT
ncbi:uncharacterized protein LOC130675799 isoform X2 [Microplitis mediator]|uniref:uncharacterized protein LOC130675799 isoform X2 n=1 Tax=Microplitis mediator TaxID=375433 RepID=UPI002556A024|nr:uncharacterized protein LOC130675799 isoform X2 [Microplitis mediator]